MVKIYYNIELNSKTIYHCVHELKDHTIGLDYKTIYHKGSLVFTDISIRKFLLKLEEHNTSKDDRTINGNFVESVSGVFLGE